MKDKNKKKDFTNNVVVKTSKDITGKQSLLMIPLTKFFCQKKNIDILLNVLEGKSKISLRLIDWFVTNYSKKYNVVYNKNNYESNIVKPKKEEYSTFNDFFIVYNDYKSQLKEVSKKHFDPFCRRQRIHFYYTKDKFILTTVGQLNFFKWAIENNILGYIEENMKEIEYDMNFSTKNNKREDDNDICRENDKNYTKKKTDIIQATCEKKNTVKKNLKRNKSNKKDSKKDIEDKEKNSEKNSEKEKNMKNKEKLDKTKKNVVINKKKTTQRKKRKELSESASKSIIKYHYPITIEFD